jgi:hypothetical protein
MKPGKSTYFRLEKLYLDCIDNQGNCFIVYWVNLKLLFSKIIYSGLIFSDSEGVTIEKASLKNIEKPLINELLVFYNRFMNLRGSWKCADNPPPLFSFKDAKTRELVWNCHHPKALTEIVYDNNTYKGFGYAETLSMKIKPWDLPIDELRWGRFLSDRYTIIWINWEGKYPVNKIFCNGIEYNDIIFESERISFGSGIFILLFLEIFIVRKGILSKIFSNMPWLKIIFKKSILNTLEVKYKARSILNENSITIANGWSLYETVTWER